MYVIYSERTGLPYIDSKRRSILFDTEEKAEVFVENNGKVYMQEAADGLKHTLSECYAAGAKAVRYTSGDDSIRQEAIQEDRLERRFYNGGANANIALYAHTRDTKYLGRLQKNKFIVPIKITNHPEVSVVYSTVSAGGRPYLYLAFTDLSEYRKWGEGKDEWMPLMVDFNAMKRIGRKHGFLINVYGMKFVMTANMFRKIREEQV